ncbi:MULTISPECIES: DUF349 domain-containing protein [unclassified Salinibacterium]|uniref:DUF349 domain-containing protein n=1 Tax=unclassified Salinibacterium TaxID=2632331 RepID=UPI00174A679F|nr:MULTISPECIES: DUF349 domain-containing protein [unclassified Salinibacterium]
MSDEQSTPWGRVDDDGTVYVREADGERAVGQYPDATPAEALAYYERKFVELDGQVTLLEQRLRAGAPAQDVAKAIAALAPAIPTANAVGDLASLTARLDKLTETVGEATEKQSAEAQQAVADAIAQREALVAEAEALAAQDLSKAQWKQVTAQLDELFSRWQAAQHSGPRIPKKDGDDLWKRFRAARTTVETARKGFFAELDSVHRAARDRKQALVERAESLAPQGVEGIPAYRRLLDEWKAAGRAGKKVDDALWAKFKAAGDMLYGAKAEADARDNVEYGANLEQKLALLDEAEPLLKATDRAAARTKLTDIQRRWDEIGKVPRDQVRVVEDRLRKIEAAVRKLEDDHWNRTDPEKQARSQGFAAQLEAAIAKAEAELATATASGDKKRIAEAQEALDKQRAWLAALG